MKGDMAVDAENKTICSYFWTSLCVRPQGRLTPCCAFHNGDLPVAQFQPNLVDLEASYNVPFFQQLRVNALQGKENKGCAECYFREKESGRSLRLRANQDGALYDSSVGRLDQVTYVELFIGNRCNLKCVMCSPELSSSLAHDYVKLGLLEEQKAVPYENSYLDLVSHLKNLRRIKFVGGEPLMHKTHWELLESIPADQARHMTIEYATNCTFFPTEAQINTWNKFSDIEIYLSIDGYGLVNEYIRFPSKWERVEKNAKLFKQYLSENPKNVLGVNSVVSLFNIFNLAELVDWVREDLFQVSPKGKEPNHLLARLEDPDHMSIRHLPLSFKQDLLLQYPDTPLYGFIRGYLQTPGDVGVLDEWRKSVQQFDALRKIHWRDYIPQMAALFE